MRVRKMRARKGKAFSLLMAVLLAMQLLPLNMVLAAETDAGPPTEIVETPQAETDVDAPSEVAETPSTRTDTETSQAETDVDAPSEVAETPSTGTDTEISQAETDVDAPSEIVETPQAETDAETSAEVVETPQAIAMILDSTPRELIINNDFFIHDRQGNSTDLGDTAKIDGKAKSFLKFNGLEITGASPVELDNVKAGDLIQLQYGFHISNEKYNNVLPGDYFEIDLPKNIVFASDAVMSGAMSIGSTVFASWRIDVATNTVIVTIENDYEQLDADIYGQFGFTGTFDYLPSDDEHGETSEIKFGSETITINRTPGKDDGEPPVASSVTKSHEYDPSANEITWTVNISPPADVTVPADYDYSGYTMVDTLKNAHTYVDNSFEVKDLGADGGFGTPAPSATYNSTEKAITYNFPAGTKGPQTVRYKTTPTILPGNSANKFENKVDLSKGGYTNLGSAEDSFEMKNFFGKVAGTDIIVDGTHRYVEWKVTVTLPKSGADSYKFPDLKLIDTLPTDGVVHKFVQSATTTGGKNLAPTLGTGSRDVVNGSVPGSITDADKGKFYIQDGTLVYLFTDAEATTNSDNTTKTMVLTYYTEIVDWNESSGSNDSIKAENRATVEWAWGPSSPWGTGSGSGAGIGEIIVGKEIIKQGASIRKGAGPTVNFDHSSDLPNKGDYLKWTITVNERLRTDMGNTPNSVSITDLIPVSEQDLHELVIDADHPLTVTEKGSPAVVNTFTSESAPGQSLGALSEITSAGFTFTFVKYAANFRMYTVTFYTKLTAKALSQMYQNKASGATNDVTKSFKNGVTLTPGNLTAQATQTYRLEMLRKSAQSYNYATRELVWKMMVNRNRLEMTNAVVTDALPANTRLQPDNERAIKVKVNGGPEQTLAELRADGTNIIFASAASPKGFTLTWPKGDGNKTSDTYEIIINTYVEDEAVLSQGDKTFENNASLEIDEHTGAFEAKGTHKITNSIVKKGHDYGNGKDSDGNAKESVTWTVALNKSVIDLKDAMAEDTLNDSLRLIPDSIELYRASINSGNGDLTPDGTAMTKVPGATPAITLGANEYGVAIDGQKLTVSLPDGPYAYVLKFTTSILGEISALTNTVFFKGSHTSPQATDKIVGINVVDPYADGGSGSYVLKVLKVDENGNPLNGAKLRLVSAKGDFQYKAGVPRDPFGETGAAQTVTDSSGSSHTIQQDGVIVFDKLPPWVFYVRELEPAPGYLLVNGNYGGVKPTHLSGVAFAGAPNDSITNAAHITVTNVKGLADIQINKTSADNMPLAGAKFGLFKKGESSDLTKLLDTATSAAGTGAVIFKDVAFGEYEIKELSAPLMHKPNTTLVYVKVDYKELSPSGYDYTTAEVRYSTDGVNYNSTSIPKFVNAPDNTGISGNPDIVFKKLRAVRSGNPTAPLQDVVFTLKDSTGASIITAVGDSGTAKSDANGTVRFTDVPFGKYTIFETVPAGYLNPNANPSAIPVFWVDVSYKTTGPTNGLRVRLYDNSSFTSVPVFDSEGTAASPEVINHAAVADVSFAKESTTSATAKINGGTFQIQGQAVSGFPASITGGTIDSATGVYTATATSVNGVVTFKSVPVNALGETYTIKELTPPSGYYSTDKQLKAEVRWNADQTALLPLVYQNTNGSVTESPALQNTPVPSSPSSGKASVMKKDEDGKPLAGAEFTLYDSTGKAIASATSGSNGLVEFIGLSPYSSFTIRETKAPDGYVLSSDELRVTTASATVRSFTVVNKKAVAEAGAILILKTDSDGNPLSGAEFTLYDKDGRAVATDTTGVDGKVSFENLPVGQYTVAETHVPSGYVRVAGNQDITLSKNEQRSLTVINEAKPNVPTSVLGSIRLMKVNSDREPLAGAEFTLYAADGSVFARETTGSNGLAVFADLPIGEYTVRETVAPDGYRLIEEDLPVALPLNGAAQSYTLKDSSLDEEPEVAGWEEDGIPGKLPQTGGAAPSFFLLLSGIALAITGFVWNRKEVYFSKHRKK
ncbi:SpaA isopeptide-forming pilin-related protein [Oscillibacter sp.]|uniref:SpaA isopeptide-forming pilin-related protein n=1 Tax=Oscillibacter sp. TaxID=1945593 RepID=UPI0028B248ED|nr:SpaA isopeptide-forming pilin-related protein [Oscillibacter sp.]